MKKDLVGCGIFDRVYLWIGSVLFTVCLLFVLFVAEIDWYTVCGISNLHRKGLLYETDSLPVAVYAFGLRLCFVFRRERYGEPYRGTGFCRGWQRDL